MANIMNLKNIKNNVRRSGFDMSHRNCFTAKVGEILPVFCQEVLPGDKWKINLREFMRTAPVNTASFGRVRQYYDWYFVPYNLLWDKWDSWIMQTKNAFHAKDITSSSDNFPTHPYFTFADLYNYIDGSIDYDDIYFDSNLPDGATVETYTNRLLMMLGYPLPPYDEGVANVALNPFPLLAYQKIYQDYFRNTQWEDAAPWTYNLDYVLSTSQLHLDLTKLLSSSTVRKSPNMFTLRYANYDKDYFNGLLPTPQYGDTAIAGPLSGEIKGLGDMLVTQGNSGLPLYTDSGGLVANSPFPGLRISTDMSIQNREGNLGLSILLLRQAECLQKWKEITLSGDTDYKTQLQKHWNVSVSNDNSYMCDYLGGSASNIDISEVINTNLDAENSVADIAGKGVSASDGFIKFDSHQYGLLMCVYHAKPLIEWNVRNMLPKMLTKTHATDYAIPEFDSIGMQAVNISEFIFDYGAVDKPAGYAPRYVEYKTAYDKISGEFQTNLRNWVIPHQLSVPDGEITQVVNYKTFKIATDVLDNMFAVDASGADQFRNTVYFDAKVVRNLDRDGLPY